MENYLILIFQVFLIFFGSCVAGYIPLLIKFSKESLKRIFTLGSGLLVGTTLTVLIPEGMSMLYKYNKTFHQNILEQRDSTIIFDQNSVTIGLSLGIGFVFTLLIDQISSKFNEGFTKDKNITITVGLVTHAAADGIALGTAATTNVYDVELIIFLSLILHKGTVAFALVTFLLENGNNRKTIIKNLGIFSISGPIFAIFTYFLIEQVQSETFNSYNSTSIAMLFAAGTFLYVSSVHILPNLNNSHMGVTQEEYNLFEPKKPIVSYEESGIFKYSELILFVSGTIMPIIFKILYFY